MRHIYHSVNSHNAFANAIGAVKLETIATAAEIRADSVEKSSLRNYNFWTADFAVYSVDNGEPCLYVAPPPHNTLFKNPQETSRLLSWTDGFFPVSPDLTAKVIADPQTKRIPLRSLRVDVPSAPDSGYMQFFPSEYASLEGPALDLLRVSVGNVDRIMRLLSEKPVGKTGFSFLLPNYVKRKFEEKGPFACAVIVSDFRSGAYTEFACRDLGVELAGVYAESDRNLWMSGVQRLD